MKRITVFIILIGLQLVACSRWNVEPKTTTSGSGTGTGTDGSKTIYSKGQVSVPGLKGYDLDAGKITDDGAVPADFYWNVETYAGKSRADLYAHNGAKFTITTIDKSVLDQQPSSLYTTLTQQTYSDNPIATDSNIPIRLGTVIAFQTNEGRYGVFRVDRLGTDLVLAITWITYNK